MKISVRAMKIDDAAGIADILNPIVEHGGITVLDSTFSTEQEAAFLRNFPERGIFAVAVGEGGRITGFQVSEPFASYTHAFDHVASIGTYVDLSLRGKGVGSAMCRHTFKKAAEKGYGKFFTYVLADNEQALRFYMKQGFTVVGTARRQARLGGRYHDEIVIEKMLHGF
jgi:L-amino acid N-acyltransferase YncA